MHWLSNVNKIIISTPSVCNIFDKCLDAQDETYNSLYRHTNAILIVVFSHYFQLLVKAISSLKGTICLCKNNLFAAGVSACMPY